MAHMVIQSFQNQGSQTPRKHKFVWFVKFGYPPAALGLLQSLQEEPSDGGQGTQQKQLWAMSPQVDYWPLDELFLWRCLSQRDLMVFSFTVTCSGSKCLFVNSCSFYLLLWYPFVISIPKPVVLASVCNMNGNFHFLNGEYTVVSLLSDLTIFEKSFMNLQ